MNTSVIKGLHREWYLKILSNLHKATTPPTTRAVRLL